MWRTVITKDNIVPLIPHMPTKQHFTHKLRRGRQLPSLESNVLPEPQRLISTGLLNNCLPNIDVTVYLLTCPYWLKNNMSIIFDWVKIFYYLSIRTCILLIILSVVFYDSFINYYPFLLVFFFYVCFILSCCISSYTLYKNISDEKIPLLALVSMMVLSSS